MAFETVPANDRVSGPYVATAGQTVFLFDFPAYQTSEVAVSRTRAGIVSTLALSVDYGMTIDANGSGGAITLTVPAVAGDVITIHGDTSLGRETAFDPRGDFTATEVNRQLNRLHMLAQENARDLGRTLRVPVGNTLADLPAGNGYLLKTDNEIVLAPGTGVADARNVTVTPALAPQQDIDLFTLLDRCFDVRRFGAKCDARTVFDAGMSNGSPVVNSVKALFGAADVGKTVLVQGAVPNSGLSRRPLVASIVSVQSPTQATLSANATQTIANAELIVGSDDTSAIQAGINALGYMGGRLIVPGHCIVTNLSFTGNNCRLIGTGPCRFSIDETAWGNNLPPVLADVPSRLIYAGVEGGVMLLHDIGLKSGLYRKLAGNGGEDVVLDGAGRAGRCVRLFTAPQYRYERCVMTRATDVHFLAQATTNVAARNQWGNVAARDGRMVDCDIYNRGTNIFGSKTHVLAGDKGDDWGNLNYHWFLGCNFLVEDDGSLRAHHVEQADNIFYIGCNWNARLVLHAADSGAYSTFRGYLPGTQLLDATAPSTRTITLRGGRFRLSVVGTGSVTVAAGTATITGGGAASAGSPRDFEITGPTGDGGTIVLTVTGSITSWTLVARHWASQCRTIHISGGAGLVEMMWAQGSGVGGASGAGFHPTNITLDYVIENINSLPIVTRPGGAAVNDPGPDARVTVDSGAPSQTAGSFVYGSNAAGVLLALAADQAIPSGVWTPVSFPAPAAGDDQLGAYSAGAPTLITVPALARAMRIRGTGLWASNAAGVRGLALARGGVRVELALRPANGGGDVTDQSVELGRIGVVPGQQWRLEAIQASGGPLNLTAGATRLEVTFF